MSRKRTIVGSWPHRRQLRGREALERALALCKAWPPEYERTDSPRAACTRAFWARSEATEGDVNEAPYVGWLPASLHELSVADIIRMLRGEVAS